MENNKTDVIVVGAGPAGVSAAITIAQAGKKVLLLERSDNAGDKNVFGGCIYTHQTEDIFYNFKEEAPLERGIIDEKIIMLTDTESVEFSHKFSSDKRYGAYTVLRSKWDKWCINQAEKAGVYFAPKTLVKELIKNNGNIIGVKTQFEEYYANIVIVADGVNSLLAKQIGLRDRFKDENVTLNVKEVYRLPKQRLEDRFNINDKEGIAAKILGGPLKDMFAMGFMYTNEDTISIGYGISLDILKANKIKPYELMDKLKEHPSISKYLKDAEFVEYSAHMIPEGSLDNIPKVYDNGVLIAGDAACFVNNIHFEGTNLAMLSGKLAGETAIFALEKGDFSAPVLSGYYKKLKSSIIIKDLKTHNDTISFLKKNINTITSLYPKIACELLSVLTTADGIPKKNKYNKLFSDIMKSGCVQKSIPLGMFAMGKCIKK